MNYIKQVNAFNQLWRDGKVTPNEVLLWYALMDINNLCNWSEWFKVANTTIAKRTGITPSNVVRTRKQLEKKGFLESEKNTHKQAPKYKMVILYDMENIRDEPEETLKPRYTPRYTNDNHSDNQVITNMISNVITKKHDNINVSKVSHNIPRYIVRYTNDNQRDNKVIIRVITLNKHINKTYKQNNKYIYTLNHALIPKELPSNAKPLTKRVKKQKNVLSDESFNEIWGMYPRKQGDKQKARKSIEKSLKNGATIQEIVNGIKMLNDQLEKGRLDKQFIPYGTTYFSGERWRDEYINVIGMKQGKRTETLPPWTKKTEPDIGEETESQKDYIVLDLPF